MNQHKINITKILNSQAIEVYQGSRGDLKELQWSLPMENDLATFNRLFNYCNLHELKGSIKLEIEFNQPLLNFIIDL